MRVVPGSGESVWWGRKVALIISWVVVAWVTRLAGRIVVLWMVGSHARVILLLIALLLPSIARIGRALSLLLLMGEIREARRRMRLLLVRTKRLYLTNTVFKLIARPAYFTAVTSLLFNSTGC